MADFSKGGAARTPLGKVVPYSSTKGLVYARGGFTFGKALIPAVTIDGDSQKILQPGVILAKATSGADSGKVGVFSAAATDGRQTAANIVGVNDTWLPWTLLERDTEVTAIIGGRLIQTLCAEYDGTSAKIALGNTTRDAIYALAKFRNLVFD